MFLRVHLAVDTAQRVGEIAAGDVSPPAAAADGLEMWASLPPWRLFPSDGVTGSDFPESRFASLLLACRQFRNQCPCHWGATPSAINMRLLVELCRNGLMAA